MRSTYDRTGGNETADASHFLYQAAENFNVTLDVEGRGVLYFVRTNHWHGSPWHYEVDGTDYIVKESTTKDPTRKLDNAVFLPEKPFPNPLTWTYSATKGADLMWVPIPFEKRLRLAYSRTFYGTGYYIYHLYAPDASLSRPIRSWNDSVVPDEKVLQLLRSAGTDIAPVDAAGMRSFSGRLKVKGRAFTMVTFLDHGPAMIRAVKLSVPKKYATEFGRGRIRITWDGRKAPSVDAPVSLFFGSGTLHNRGDKKFLVKALPVNVRFDKGRVQLACYFPMPFFSSARVELAGPDGMAIPDVSWSIRTEPYRDPPDHVGYFHATYRDHPDPAPGRDNVFLDTDTVEGGGPWCGSFVGTSFIFSDRAVLTTLEGDPRFFFDDSMTPQAYGTGTEEWGGGGDYWGGRTMTLPLAGHPAGVRKAEDAACREELIQSAYRFLLADLMPFGKRAVICLEHGGTNNSQEHYQSVSYWYGLPAASLLLTDVFDVGDASDEKLHQYKAPGASDAYQLTSRYEWGVDHITRQPDVSVKAEPGDYAAFQFNAEKGKRYYIWVRGKSDGGILTDAAWLQFDSCIGTDRQGDTYNAPKGFGNWRDAVDPGVWAWSSGLPGDKQPYFVVFKKSGMHRLKIQRRHGPHFIDRIYLSTTQKRCPEPAFIPDQTKASAPSTEIVLTASDVVECAGGISVVKDATSRAGKVIKVGGSKQEAPFVEEIYPAHTETGRITTGSTGFTMKIRPDNWGVLLRRTLDYKYPNQRAEVYVGRPEKDSGKWDFAGIWYLAGSNTCYHSYPWKGGELGPSNPVVQTSNRRFRDDEFLVSHCLTRGRSRIRFRIVFTPETTPLLPGRKPAERAWSEIRYKAYCWCMPQFRPGFCQDMIRE